jgi:hypothetical protein
VGLTTAHIKNKIFTKIQKECWAWTDFWIKSSVVLRSEIGVQLQKIWTLKWKLVVLGKQLEYQNFKACICYHEEA